MYKKTIHSERNHNKLLLKIQYSFYSKKNIDFPPQQHHHHHNHLGLLYKGLP